MDVFPRFKKVYKKVLDMLMDGRTQKVSVIFEGDTYSITCKMVATAPGGFLFEREIKDDDEYKRNLYAWRDGEPEAEAFARLHWVDFSRDAEKAFREHSTPKRNFMTERGFTIETSTQQ